MPGLFNFVGQQMKGLSESDEKLIEIIFNVSFLVNFENQRIERKY